MTTYDPSCEPDGAPKAAVDPTQIKAGDRVLIWCKVVRPLDEDGGLFIAMPNLGYTYVRAGFVVGHEPKAEEPLKVAGDHAWTIHAEGGYETVRLDVLERVS